MEIIIYIDVSYELPCGPRLLPVLRKSHSDGDFLGRIVSFRLALISGAYGECPTITLAPQTLPLATQGVAYSHSITATGGTAPLTFNVSAGYLPAGLTLNSATGVLSGTPTTSNGTGVTIAIRVADAEGCQGSRMYSFQNCPVISIVPTTVSGAEVGVPYSQAFAVVGDSGPCAFTIASGSLPVGLTLDSSTGVLSGVPTGTGSRVFTVSARSAAGCRGTRSYALVSTGEEAPSPPPASEPDQDPPTQQEPTDPAPPPPPTPVPAVTAQAPSITLQAGTALPPAMVSSAYALQVPVSAGAGGEATSYTAKGLPSGLTINAESGLISGTPTAARKAPYEIVLTAGNAVGKSSVKVTLTVTAIPAGLVGSYAGLLGRSASFNHGLGGRIDLTATATGMYTGRLALGGVNLPLHGQLAVGSGATIQATGSAEVPWPGMPALHLTFTLDAASNGLSSGHITDGSADLEFNGWRHTWTRLNPALQSPDVTPLA